MLKGAIQSTKLHTKHQGTTPARLNIVIFVGFRLQDSTSVSMLAGIVRYRGAPLTSVVET